MMVVVGDAPMDQIVTAAVANWFWTVIGLIAIISIVMSTIKSIVNNAARERSRREIAAYIAEGSMTPEQGERLLRTKTGDSGCP
jgi:hypothetical protein